MLVLLKEFTYIHDEKNTDFWHDLGQIFLRPISIVCGHTFRIIKKPNENPQIQELPELSTIQKIIIIALAFMNPLFFLVLGFGVLGIALLHYSKTHSEDFDLVQEAVKNNTTQFVIIR